MLTVLLDGVSLYSQRLSGFVLRPNYLEQKSLYSRIAEVGPLTEETQWLLTGFWHKGDLVAADTRHQVSPGVTSLAAACGAGASRAWPGVTCLISISTSIFKKL